MTRVFITGVAGYLGQRIARRLLADPSVTSVSGLDLAGPIPELPEVEVATQDVRAPMDALMKGVDTAVHLAWILNPSRRPEVETDINIGGSRAFLAACARAGVRRIVGLSSATAYGAWEDNPIPIPEAQLVRPDQGFQYAREKAWMEGLFRQFGEFHPETDICLLRPSIILGPGTDNYIVRGLDRRLVPVVRGLDPPWQFLHEDDLAEAVTRTILSELTGAWNVAPEGTVPRSEVAQRLGARLVEVPDSVAGALTSVGWRLGLKGLTEAPPEILDFIRWPWVVDGTRLREALGLSYDYDSEGTLQSWLAARG